MYKRQVLIIATYDENGTADAMNAAWGGISDDTQISMCLSAEHKTVKNILTRGAFTAVSYTHLTGLPVPLPPQRPGSSDRMPCRFAVRSSAPASF